MLIERIVIQDTRGLPFEESFALVKEDIPSGANIALEVLAYDGHPMYSVSFDSAHFPKESVLAYLGSKGYVIL